MYVENRWSQVDDMCHSPTVHRTSAFRPPLVRLSSTATAGSQASVYRARTLSSPASTVAKMTDENAFSLTDDDKYNHLVDSVDGHPSLERSNA